LFNTVELVRLTRSESRLGSSAADAEREAERLRTEASSIRTRIDTAELQSVAAAAREANGIIDRRAFSWTELFSQLEATLPPNVRIKAVQPRPDRNMFLVVIVAEARRSEDLADFMDALEDTQTFSSVKPLSETTSEEGIIEAIIEGVYAAPARSAPGQDTPQRTVATGSPAGGAAAAAGDEPEDGQ
jgi:Tfp pilus assembly protein PilN